MSAIIRMKDAHMPNDMTAWLGDSIGHWEGDTLVVETTDFHEEIDSGAVRKTCVWSSGSSGGRKHDSLSRNCR